MSDYVTFRLDGRDYATRIGAVREVVRMAELVALPGMIAPLAGVPGRSPGSSVALRAVALQLRALQVALGPYSPSEAAARYRLGTGPAPSWLAVRSGA